MRKKTKPLRLNPDVNFVQLVIDSSFLFNLSYST